MTALPNLDSVMTNVHLAKCLAEHLQHTPHDGDIPRIAAQGAGP
jgi:hypothetical protein